MLYNDKISDLFYFYNQYSILITINWKVQVAGQIILVLMGSILIYSLLNMRVKHRANYYDALTKLPNRRFFEKKIKKTDVPQCLAIWHMHNFEHVNRERDYQFGDKVITQLTALLKEFETTEIKLYRLDGHRFAFHSNHLDGVNHLHRTMEKVAENLQKPFVIEGYEMYLPAVCAISKAYDLDETINIFTNAIAVLNFPSIEYNYEIIHYDSAIHTYVFELEIEEDVIQAIKNEELFIVYQPKVNGITNAVVGVETLLRWNHPTHGFLSPAIFIPILERNNRIVHVTDWIIERVCQQIADWKRDGITFKQVAINIPGQYVTSSLLLDVLKRNLRKYKLEPLELELEITETSFVENMENAIKAVSTLRKEGFSVALDDFGTGVSSLSYLKKMPISTMKIDKSFIDGIPESKKDSSIMKAIIDLGHSLNLAIVFEGVETEEQVKFLTTTCEKPIIQGYYFARPMKANELVQWQKEFCSS
ncbi:bifunctional diguanylate cyclase/phosphodiesterase [Psychrobacillus sp. FJAT-51614]|uniref:Bifunctional diguanylate cyclase/phosphodiesterase n=1 Tax=Psychrobacillus mangrovi TaxID=3117745 RepID=A0ABU8F4K7_9BACI